MLNDEEKYKHNVLQALSDIQMLEMSLKIYISTCYKIIKKSTNGVIVFDYSYKDIENFPLERLLNIFQKLSDDKPFNTRLNKIRTGRNKLAHKALVLSHDIFREILDEDLGSNHKDVISLHEEVNECLMTMSEHLQKAIDIFNDMDT